MACGPHPCARGDGVPAHHERQQVSVLKRGEAKERAGRHISTSDTCRSPMALGLPKSGRSRPIDKALNRAPSRLSGGRQGKARGGDGANRRQKRGMNPDART